MSAHLSPNNGAPANHLVDGDKHRLCQHCRWYAPILTASRDAYVDWCGHPNHSGVVRQSCRDWQREPGADDE